MRRAGGALRIGERTLPACGFGSLPETSSTLVSIGPKCRGGCLRSTLSSVRSPESRGSRAISDRRFRPRECVCRNSAAFFAGEDRINRALVDLASKFRLALIATNGVQYANRPGAQVLDVFTCIREHTHLDARRKITHPKCGTSFEKRCGNVRDLSRFTRRNHEHGAIGGTARIFPRKHRLRISRICSSGRAHDEFVPAHDGVIRRATALRIDHQESKTSAGRGTLRSSPGSGSPAIF